MNDRELLELAAKASPLFNGKPWNPLTDDGDALRLAVKLKIDICFGHDCMYTQTTIAPTPMFKEAIGTDPYAAARRAIVRAAAEIGRTMP